MIKKIFLTLIVSCFLAANAYSAGSSDSGSNKTKNNYDKAVSHIKVAKKYEKKGKTEKANKRYEKALKLLTKSNIEKPNIADTLKSTMQSLNLDYFVTGGFDYQDLSKILGFSLGVAITGSEKIGPSLMITEGFGNISMASRTFDLLKTNENKYASLNGSTQIRAGVIRPELVVPLKGLSLKEKSFDDLDLVIAEGSMVRVIREPYFGSVGIVKKLPSSLKRMESETEVRVAEIEFEDDRVKTIPRANLEMILS